MSVRHLLTALRLQDSNADFYNFSTPPCEIKGNKQTTSQWLYVSLHREKTGKMKKMKNISLDLRKRLHGEYKESKTKNISNVSEVMNFCSL